MLKAIWENIGNRGAWAEIYLVGEIDETTNFEALLGSVPGDIRINCKKITRINSRGIRSWVHFFTRLRNSGKRVVFHKVSPILVEMMHAFYDFHFGAVVTSVCVPYLCSNCRKEYIGVVSRENIETFAHSESSSHLSCPCCGGEASFNGGDRVNYLRPLLA